VRVLILGFIGASGKRNGGLGKPDILSRGRLQAYPQFHISPIGVDVQHGPKLPPL
jgi:hypothetical protein